jgi:hypothetical protein
MRTVEVPQKDWARTLNEFSARHQGWLVSLDVIGPTLGVQPQIRGGVTAESGLRGSAITISAARFDGEQITHLIPSAARVRIERTNECSSSFTIPPRFGSCRPTLQHVKVRTPFLTPYGRVGRLARI